MKSPDQKLMIKINSRDIKGIERCLLNGANPNMLYFGESILHSECSKSNLKIIELLLRYGANVNARTETGLTPLHYAVIDDNIEVVKILLDYKADINAVTSLNESAFYSSVCHDMEEMIDFLIDKVDINIRDFEGQSPLHKAIETQNLKVACQIMDQGGDIDEVNKFGTNFLMMLCDAKKISKINILINKGADIHFENEEGVSAFKILKRKKYVNVEVKSFIQKIELEQLLGSDDYQPNRL